MAQGTVGRVVNLTPKGALIVKAPGPLRVSATGRKEMARAEGPAVKIGSILLDARRETAGKVIDVIGPVASPYLIVAPPKGGKPNRLLGKELFVRS